MVGLAILFIAFYSQYLVAGFGPITGTLMVYGVPFLTATVMYGRTIWHHAFRNTGVALKFGVSSFGMFQLLGTVASMIIVYLLNYVSPEADDLLNRHNPVLNVSREYAWFMMLISVVVIGPVEEYIFRGFVYGGLLNLYKGQHWLSLAFLSSLFFAVAHLYYALVYGIASLIALADLIAFSMAMSFAYYFSGGNVLVPALIHGLYDAGGFLAVAVSPQASSAFRGGMIVLGVVVAMVLAGRSLRKTVSI
jgi:membrane protease YdiL (CAAX protease family)